MDHRTLKQIDPVHKQSEVDLGEQIFSPMAPPEAYTPPNLKPVDVELMHPFLKIFHREHELFMEELKVFEQAILTIQSSGFTKELNGKLSRFFRYFDEEFVPHSRREEEHLFPLLNKRLILSGEHSKGEKTTTAVDLMVDDHVKALQLAAVVMNFLGMAFRLPDDKSRLILLDTALEQGKNLVELLRLHIFREDNVVFSLSHQLITSDEFNKMQESNRHSKAIN